MAYVGNQVRCCPMRISMPLSILLVVSYSQDHLRECLGPCRFFWCLECCSFPIGSIHSRVPCWGFSITRMGLFPPPFLASVWFLFSHTAVEDKDLYSLKMFCFRGKSEGDWSQLLEPLQITLLYGNSHCKPDISSVFCSQEFLGSPSIGMDRLTLAVCFVLSPPKQLRKSHSPLGKSECFKSL